MWLKDNNIRCLLALGEGQEFLPKLEMKNDFEVSLLGDWMDIGVMNQIKETGGRTNMMGSVSLTLGILNLRCLKNIQVEISRKNVKYKPRTKAINYFFHIDFIENTY